MGNKYSTPVTRSPSAAFGRLRIDSPNPRAGQRHRQLLQNRSPGANGHLTASLRDVSLGDVGSGGGFDGVVLGGGKQQLPSALIPPTEKSPLIWRRLESLPSDISVAGPPSYWIVIALICALCYALYNIFIKLGSQNIHPILGGVILQFVAAVLGTLLLTGMVWKDGFEELNYDSTGIFWAMCAGLAVGAAEILSFIVSGLGTPASKSIPVIIGGSVGFGCILSLILLKEMLSYQGWMGVILIVAGVALVGTDPNAADSFH